jgi:site-specific recombinase XerD
MKQRLSLVNTDSVSFQDLFITSNRVASEVNKIARIIDPDNIDAFFDRLQEGVTKGQINLEVAAAVSLGISAGLRVNECLSIKSNQINPISGVISGIEVLKKRKEGVVRKGILHPVGLNIVLLFINEFKRRPHEFLIRLSRQQLDRSVKVFFDPGTDWHAMCRHTHVSVCIHQGVGAEKTAKLLCFSNLTVLYAYVHSNTDRDLEKLYKRVA